MNDKEKKANEDKFLEHIYDTLKIIMDKRPAQPVYEYANILLKAVGNPKEDYLERVKARKEMEDDSKEKKKRKSSSSSSEDSGQEDIKDTTNEDNYSSKIKMIQKRKLLENEFGSYDWSDSSSSDSSDQSDESEDSDKPKRKKGKKKGKHHEEKREHHDEKHGDDAEKKE